jgi:hypothetical protein
MVTPPVDLRPTPGNEHDFFRNFRNIAFRLTQITSIFLAVSSHLRGVSRSSRTRGGMSWSLHRQSQRLGREGSHWHEERIEVRHEPLYRSNYIAQSNLHEPEKPIYWHFTIMAQSAAEAVRLIQSAPDCRGLPARVVVRLG